jgi:cyclic pyranopterin phosphate synthase
MPEEEYIWVPREDLLTFEEIRELVGIFTELGVGTRSAPSASRR